MFWLLLFCFVCTHGDKFLYIHFRNQDEPDMRNSSLLITNADDREATVYFGSLNSAITLQINQSRRFDAALIENKEAELINVTSGFVYVQGLCWHKGIKFRYSISKLRHKKQSKYYLSAIGGARKPTCVVSAIEETNILVNIAYSQPYLIHIDKTPAFGQYYKLKPLELLFLSGKHPYAFENVSLEADSEVAVFCGGNYARMQILPSTTHCGRFLKTRCPASISTAVDLCNFILYNTNASDTSVRCKDGTGITDNITLRHQYGIATIVSNESLLISSLNNDICVMYTEFNSRGTYAKMLNLGLPTTAILVKSTTTTHDIYSTKESTDIASMATTQEIYSTKISTDIASMATTSPASLSSKRGSICQCFCICKASPANLSTEELREKINRVKRILAVNKVNLSSTRRQKISVMETRKSAQRLGVLAISILSITAAAIVLCDLQTCFTSICIKRSIYP